MPIIENGKAVLVDLDGKLKLVPAEQAEAAMSQNGWSEATPHQVEVDDARKAELQKPYVEQVAGAGLAGLASVGGAIGSVIPEALGGLSPEEEKQAGDFLRSPLVTGQRAASPAAFSTGQSVPAIAAGVLLPGAGAAGLAATIGVDVASGYSQAAVDAEIENRGISGADVLRNAGLNLAFSLPLYGLGEYARISMQGKRLSALERAAGNAKDTAGARAAASEGADLAQAVADPAVQADLLDRVSTNASDAVARMQAKVEGLSAPVVSRNPRAQREAVGAIADVMRTADPELAARLDGLTKGSARARLKGLRAIRDELAAAGDSDALTAIDATIGREDLWGSKAIRGAADVDSVLGSIPDGADPEQLIEFAARARKIRDGEFAGIADEIEQYAERQIEIRTASAVGDVTPQAVDDVVDYRKAMQTIDPSEAWRLTHDGADDGLRKIEAASVSDAFQRADDVFREDAGLAVKREDFVKGAESWTPAVIAKQGQWTAERLGKVEQLAADLAGAERQGRNLGGYRAEVTGHIDRALQRIRGADPITANLEFDQLKRNLDGVGKRLAASPAGSIDDASKAWGSRAILDVSDDLRKGLEDSELWGRNAGLQKETNAAWVAIIEPYSRVTKQMAELLSREFGVVGGAGIRRRFDPDMIESLMSRGYQRNLRSDISAALKGLDQMAQARQSKGLSRLDRLSQMRADLVRIQQGFDFADLLAVAKSKAKAPIGLEIAGRLADTATPGGFVGSVAGPLAARAKGAYTQGMPMLAPGSKSPLAGAVRRHLGMTRSEQAAMLADPAFYERLPGSLQKQLMGGSAAGERAVEMASAAADAAKRDRDLTVRLMVNPEDAKRARKAMRKPTPAIDRARKRAAQRGMIQLGGEPSPGIVGARRNDPVPPGKVRVYVDTDGMLWRDGVPGNEGKMRPATEAELEFTRTSKRDLFHVDDVAPAPAPAATESPVDLTGKSLAELGALTDPASFRPGSFERLRGAGAEEFRKTGRVPESVSKADHRNGIRVRLGEAGEGKEMYLVDGRHRLTVAKEAGTPQIWGTVYDPDGKEIYRGFIPLNGAGAPAAGQPNKAAVKKALAEYERISAESAELDELIKKAQDDLDEAESAFQALGTDAFYEFKRRYAADEVSRADYNKVIRARKAADKDRAKAQKALDSLSDRALKLEENSGDADLEDALGEAVDAGADIPEWEDAAGAARRYLGGQRGMVEIGGPRVTPGTFARRGKWSPNTDIEKVVDEAIRRNDTDPDVDVLAELDTPAAVRKTVLDRASDMFPGDMTPAQKAEMKAAVKAAVDDIDVKAGYHSAYESAFGEAHPQAGFADLAGGIAKSPLGVGTGAAGAVVAYHHIAEPKQPDPESMTPLERFSDGYERPSDAFRAARKMIRDWQGNPEALVDMIAGHVGDVGQLSPKLEREMTGQAMRIAGYLQDNLPGQRNISVVYPDGTPPSRAEVRQFALRFGAAVDPAGVMADARMGRLERTQLDTLYAVWPAEYDALRAGVIQELGTGRATTQTRQRMSLLFSFGSEIDPALGPRTRAVVAAARGAQEQKAPAPSSPGMNRQKLPSTANMQPAGMAALSLGQQIGP